MLQTTLFLSATNVWPLPLLAEWFYWSLTVEDGSLSFLFTSVKVSVMSLLEPGTAGGSRETVLDTQHTHYFSHILQYNFIKKKKKKENNNGRVNVMKVACCSNKTCGFITSTTTVQVISVTCLQPICEHFFYSLSDRWNPFFTFLSFTFQW